MGNPASIAGIALGGLTGGLPGAARGAAGGLMDGLMGQQNGQLASLSTLLQGGASAAGPGITSSVGSSFPPATQSLIQPQGDQQLMGLAQLLEAQQQPMQPLQGPLENYIPGMAQTSNLPTEQGIGGFLPNNPVGASEPGAAVGSNPAGAQQAPPPSLAALATGQVMQPSSGWPREPFSGPGPEGPVGPGVNQRSPGAMTDAEYNAYAQAMNKRGVEGCKSGGKQGGSCNKGTEAAKKPGSSTFQQLIGPGMAIAGMGKKPEGGPISAGQTAPVNQEFLAGRKPQAQADFVTKWAQYRNQWIR